MALSAQQIKDMLKPMLDFAPAILRAAEIVEEAAMAERRMPELQRSVESILTQMRDAEQRKAASEQAALKARNDLNAERDRIKADEQALRDSLKPLRDQKAALEGEIDKMQGQMDEAKKQLAADIVNLTKQRDEIAAEIAALKKKFAA